jgi:hypothetical protein
LRFLQCQARQPHQQRRVKRKEAAPFVRSLKSAPPLFFSPDHPPRQSATALVAAPEAAEGEDAPPAPATSKASFTFAGETEACECEPAEASPEDGSYTYALTKSFERTPGAALVTQLLNAPLIVTIYKGDVALATASVDLAPFAEGASQVMGDAVALTPLALEGEESAESNPLLPGATIAVAVTPSEPLMTPGEAAASCVLTLAVSKARLCTSYTQVTPSS